MTEIRQFKRGLGKAGSAALIRENVSQAVRESTCLSKPQLVEPLDYETVILKEKSILHNDPQRDMLLFPNDDVTESREGTPIRTILSATPPTAMAEAKHLFVKQCLQSYTGTCHLINYKYRLYSGDHLQLPKYFKQQGSAELPKLNYEVDVELEVSNQENSISRAISHSITRQGWLYKGPDSQHESGIINFTRSFKKRYFYLKQQADTTYVLEFHKDDKKLDTKGTIFLDSASSVVKSNKRGRTTIEILMQDSSYFVLATETDVDCEEWISTLRKVIQANENNNTRSPKSPDGGHSPFDRSPLDDCLMHPDLAKYANENNGYLATMRCNKRQNLFCIYPDLPKHNASVDEDCGIEIFRDTFGTRFAVTCEEFRTEAQANIADENQPEQILENPEPFFVTLCLYDARDAKRLSADFHYDPNSGPIRAMIADELVRPPGKERRATLHAATSEPLQQPPSHGMDEEWLADPKTAIFSVTQPHSDIYLVCRIEKVLQAGITVSTEPYIKPADGKTATKIYRNMRACCSRIGHYRMPFAWGYRPVFRLGSDLDVKSDFRIYKQESSRLSDEELLKHLQEIKRPEKQSKWIPILGRLKVKVESYCGENLKHYPNVLTSSLIPVKPFSDLLTGVSVTKGGAVTTAGPVTASPMTAGPVYEVDEFPPLDGRFCHPHSSYSNNLYVYPRSLKFDSQKSFTKARNIVCYVELRESDDDVYCPSLHRIYSPLSSSVFTNSSTTPVLHHNSTPDFYHEVKLSLPTHIHDKHHVLFTFYHVSCESRPNSRASSIKKKESVEMVVGYAWVPLLRDSKINVGDQHVAIASSLPARYMSHEPLGLGKGCAGPEVKWVDQGKQLFKCSLNLASTVHTKDPHVQNFFQHCQKMEESRTPANDVETSNKLKSLLCTDVSTMIQFLPTLMNQLFALLPTTQSEEVAVNTIKVLIHIVAMVSDVGKEDILHSYVKYVFVQTATKNQERTLHEELAKYVTCTLRPASTDTTVIIRFLKHSWFFFEIIIKSMAQYLLSTHRIKKPRNKRFQAHDQSNSDYEYRVQTLISTLLPHIMHKFREAPNETRSANKSLATFIKRCLTFMDRGFVFRLINLYMESFNIGDPKILHEYKFEFLRIICDHEHYIPLNLPLRKSHIKSHKDLKHDYTLSDEFKRKHFLVGLLLDELKSALNETADIRHRAITVVRNLLAKHALDDRVATTQHQGRIACLYLPLITIVLENKHRFSPQEIKQQAPPPPPASVMSNGDINPDLEPSLRKSSSLTKTGGLPQHRSMGSLSDQGSASSSPTLRHHRQGSNSGSLTPPTASLTPPATVKSVASVKAMIAGPSVKFADTKRLNDSNGSLASSTSGGPISGPQSVTSEKKDVVCSVVAAGDEVVERRERTNSGAVQIRSSMTSGAAIRYDKLECREIKDLLICFVQIVKNLPEHILLGWFNNSSENDIQDFFNILDLCLFYFRYQGRKKIMELSVIGNSRSAATLPPRNTAARALQHYQQHGRSKSQYIENLGERSAFHSQSASNAEAIYRTLLEANVASEMGLVALDVVSLYCNNFKEQLIYKHGDNTVMKKIFDIYLAFLRTSQSEQLLKHVFGALREFINQFRVVLFMGDAVMCGALCYEVLRSCNSRLQSTRSEACALIYLLMRHNFEFSRERGFTRVHLQVIIAVSQLTSDIRDLSNSSFTDSLSVINSYANTDKPMQQTSFPIEVKDLTKRLRTILMATAQMKEHEKDPEMLVDLQYSLAKSYASTPELRKTWLESMAKDLAKYDNHSEAAHCYLHIAALVAEYLKRRRRLNKTYPQGCAAFKRVSPNIESEECGIKDDSGMEDVQYTEDTLVDLLEHCVRMFEKAERYEVLSYLYRLIIPVYEAKRDYQKLADAYATLHRACTKVVEVTRSGRRLLGKYYRVAFFGQMFESEDGKQYIYKEPRVTSLTEICDRLKALFAEKFGKDNVRLIMDSKRVDPSDLSSKFAYIQVTYVTPFFEQKELDERPTEFERSNNMRRFMYETPFTQAGQKSRGLVDEQWKRRTILTTSHAFPYVKKRIQVVYHQEFELSPIEVAIDAMKNKVTELEDIVIMPEPGMINLQLRLQGSVSPQVNSGPMAYAEAFLRQDSQYPREKIRELKQVFRAFVRTCNDALELNATLIKSEQKEYQESMKNNFNEMVCQLSLILDEQLLPDDDASAAHAHHRSSLTVFNYISATDGATSV